MMVVVPYCSTTTKPQFPTYTATSDKSMTKLPSLLAKGFLDRSNSSRKPNKPKNKQSRPYSPPKPDDADHVPFISMLDAAIAEKWTKKKSKEAVGKDVAIDEAPKEPATDDSTFTDQETLSEIQLRAIKSYAAKYPVKRSARLIGDCRQLGSIPFGDEYVRTANDCGLILKDDNGRPIACIMD